jgi:hypothetical protein
VHYIVPYFIPLGTAMGIWSKVVHYIGPWSKVVHYIGPWSNVVHYIGPWSKVVQYIGDDGQQTDRQTWKKIL